MVELSTYSISGARRAVLDSASSLDTFPGCLGPAQRPAARGRQAPPGSAVGETTLRESPLLRPGLARACHKPPVAPCGLDGTPGARRSRLHPPVALAVPSCLPRAGGLRRPAAGCRSPPQEFRVASAYRLFIEN